MIIRPTTPTIIRPILDPIARGGGLPWEAADTSGVPRFSIDNAVAMNGGEAFGLNGGQDLAEAAYAAAFNPLINLTAWARLKMTTHRHSRGLLCQMDYGSQRRWVLTTAFGAGKEKKITIFFFNSGSDAASWSMESTNDVLPLADGRDITIFLVLKMDEATPADRAKVYIYDHSTGTLTGPIAWNAPGGTPGTTLTSNTAKFTVGNWNSRPGQQGCSAYFRAWGFHDLGLTTDEMTAIARDRSIVTRGLVDLFEPPHGYASTFAGRKGTVVTLLPAATRPVCVRLSTFPPLGRCTLVGLTAGAGPARVAAGADGRQHHGVSGQRIGDGAAPAAGTMNETATADAASYLPNVILFMGGTNDIMSEGVAAATAIARAQAFIRKVTDSDLTRKVFWGTLTRTRNTGAHPISGTYQSQVDDFNTQMDAAITTLVGEGRSVTKVTLHDKVSIDEDFVDATHPGAAGYNKIGARGWWDAIKASLPAGTFNLWFRGDSLMIGSSWNEAGEPANDGGPRVEIVAHMVEAGF